MRHHQPATRVDAQVALEHVEVAAQRVLHLGRGVGDVRVARHRQVPARVELVAASVRRLLRCSPSRGRRSGRCRTTPAAAEPPASTSVPAARNGNRVMSAMSGSWNNCGFLAVVRHPPIGPTRGPCCTRCLQGWNTASLRRRPAIEWPLRNQMPAYARRTGDGGSGLPDGHADEGRRPRWSQAYRRAMQVAGSWVTQLTEQARARRRRACRVWRCLPPRLRAAGARGQRGRGPRTSADSTVSPSIDRSRCCRRSSPTSSSASPASATIVRARRSRSCCSPVSSSSRPACAVSRSGDRCGGCGLLRARARCCRSSQSRRVSCRSARGGPSWASARTTRPT